MKDELLMTQSEARKRAKELNGEWLPLGMANVAHPVPLNSWGGHEKGWTVSLVAV